MDNLLSLFYFVSKTLFTVLTTVLVGGLITNLISSIFQKRAMINSAKIKKVEDDVKFVLELNIRINDASSSRRFAMQEIINELTYPSKQHEETLEKLRLNYKEEVRSWNINLTKFNIELSAINLYELALHHVEGYTSRRFSIEDTDYQTGIHSNFREAHYYLNYYLNIKKDDMYIRRVQNLMDIIYKETKTVSNNLINKSDRLWEDLENDYTDTLSTYNIDRASTFILILAIFNPRSHLLRIRRPN